ncbi:hypothetical protein ABIC86_003832 [Paenibacillus sp. DS2363]
MPKLRLTKYLMTNLDVPLGELMPVPITMPTFLHIL